LDLFCCQGGASAGYVAAGFDVVGVDLDPQPRYPFEFWNYDALVFLAEFDLSDIDAIHASPPCQAFTNAQKIMGNEHPDLITPTREMLERLGKPYVIENVPGAPLRDPVELCGAMFGLRTYRHRLFESNVPLEVPTHPEHVARTTKMGRPVRDGEFMHVVGNFAGAEMGREVMGMPWASRDGLREAIPPAYTEWIGTQLLEHIAAERAA
jgi:DNA (cytosine-5)-methyltransferase 1